MFAACDSAPGAPAVATAPAVSLTAATDYADTAPTFDAVLNEVSLRHPGFKGIVGSDDGTRTLVLLDPLAVLNVPGLLSDLAATLGTNPEALLASPLPTLASARPDFHDLYAVKTGLRRFMVEHDWVTYLDLDEVAGRVTVGTADEADRMRVQERMTPAERQASDFVTEGPAQLLSAAPPGRRLRTDEFFPLISGAKVAPVGGGCTQGPAVLFNGSEYGFLTNAHCTGDFETVSGTLFYQPFPSASTTVGTETAEPAYRSGWFITDGYYADIAFVRTPRGRGLEGKMTSADNCNNGGGCTENGIINDIVGTSSYLPVNVRVFKTGQKTGSTAGAIANTCVDVQAPNPTGGKVRLLCSTSVTVRSGVATTTPLSDLGDSGASVLTNGGTPGSNATTLAGVLFGQIENATTQFYFSPWENIWQQERAGSAYGLNVRVVVASEGTVANTSSGGSSGGGSGPPPDDCPPDALAC